MARRFDYAHWIGLLVVGVVLLMLQLGNSHLWDQDEGYYATAAAEMYARNDWITPTFNGKLFGHKPPMMYWGMMLGYHAFGVTEFGARFCSSIFGILTIMATYAIARRLFDANRILCWFGNRFVLHVCNGRSLRNGGCSSRVLHGDGSFCLESQLLFGARRGA